MRSLIEYTQKKRNQISVVDGVNKTATHFSPTSALNPVYGASNNFILPYFGYYNTNGSLTSVNEGHYWSYSNTNGYQFLKIDANEEKLITSNIDLEERRLVRCVRNL